jgi:glycosyltransferase involved in cell wall biosynthesis
MVLTCIQKKVVLISSGQPTLNPRLVKEADALTVAGFQVTILYAYWNNWATEYDKLLLAGKKWKAIRIGGDPKQKRFTYFISRVIFKISSIFIKERVLFRFFADLAITRSSFFLILKAKKYKADIYIAHNLGALPAAVRCSNRYGKPVGFDAEDFHRHEVNDDTKSFHFNICKFIEDKYLPGASYITASSPLIAEHYRLLYKQKVISILNVFPKTKHFSIINNINGTLKLFWFSQTIGPNRGLELIIEAMGTGATDYELHLLGNIDLPYQQKLIQLCRDNNVLPARLNFYEPIQPGDIFNFSLQFDVGLASEPGFCLNNKIALSNKIFTYIQCGLAVAASHTPAQLGLLQQYPAVGKVYGNAEELSQILRAYDKDRDLLYKTKKEAFEIGQNQLNWDVESEKFLEIIETTLNRFG